MTENDRLYLQHIQESIAWIEKYTSSGREHFMESHLTQDGVIRNFEIIGEAVKRISDETLGETPQIPWSRISRFRDVLIHGYMNIELTEVWNVIEDHIPALKQAVIQLLEK